MPTIELNYGKSQLSFAYEEDLFQVIGGEKEAKALSDSGIGERLDHPFDSPRLEEKVKPGDSVLLVVPDATRSVGSGQIVNLLVRRLIAGGIMPYDIRIIFAVGIHRPVSEAEKQTILTPFITQRLKTLEHSARGLGDIIRLGETARGIPIELNRALTEHDHVVLVGGIAFHYFAGFTGGRKLICPGLASARTISETHKLAFDCERKTRSAGVGLGLLAGNPVHEEFTAVVKALDPAFCINTITNDVGEIIDLICGGWETSHQQACARYAERNTREIREKREIVIAGCGGMPYDLNLIQAHKALEAAAAACTPGGTIILLAECSEGLGRKDFLNWFAAADSRELAENLCRNYQVNGQTAWSLLQKAEKFNLQIVTALSAEETSKMRLRKVNSLSEAVSSLPEQSKGYILPFAARVLVKVVEE